jgi:DNA-binding PadR family transcriptional regulator
MPNAAALVVSLVPALVLAAEREGASISEIIMIYRTHGLGGERACRKLLHRLERLDFLAVVTGSRADRREKSVRLTNYGRDQLRAMAEHLSRLGQAIDVLDTRALAG